MRIPKWKVFLILGTCFLGVLFLIPNFLNKDTIKQMPSFLQKQLVLGLDLQGGSQLLMEVDLKGALRDRMLSEVDEIRSVLRKGKFGYLNLAVIGDKENPAISFTARDPENIEKIKKALLELNNHFIPDIQGSIFKIKYSDAYIEERNRSVLDLSIGIISRRIDEDGTKEISVQRQGDSRILIQLPGVANPEDAKAILNRTAKMNFHMVDDSASIEDAIKGKLPPGTELLYEERKGGQPIPCIIKKTPFLSGENLVDASVGSDPEAGISVNLKFDATGGRKFGLATRENIGKRFAIALDNKILSAPMIQSAIEGGSGRITGRFTVEEAAQLSLLMRSGALPAALTVLSENTVGPDLGADSIYDGKKATLISIALVAVFMVIAYSLFGFIANIALIFNIILLIAGMTLIQATLTLPGIAGIALTIGMAVDANVLIFERIKEEIRNGRKLITAIDLGYNRAMATIWDSNITTLFGAALLYIFATGPVKGFAVTLAMGIVISMFTAVSLTRVITSWWLSIAKPKKLPI